MATFNCVKHTVFRGEVYRAGEQVVVSEADAGLMTKHFERVDAPSAPAVSMAAPAETEETIIAILEEQVETLWPVARSRGMKKADLREAIVVDGFESVCEQLEQSAKG